MTGFYDIILSMEEYFMNININNLDIERLRKDLIEHFTSAMFIVSPIALVDLTEVENANEEQIVKIALNNKFDLKKYLK